MPDGPLTPRSATRPRAGSDRPRSSWTRDVASLLILPGTPSGRPSSRSRPPGPARCRPRSRGGQRGRTV